MSEVTLDSIKKKLQQEGFKLTPQREATVSILLENREEHLSAEAVYMLVKHRYPDIGLATVYRTLEILTDIGVTYRLILEDGLARYDLKRDDHKHFHHHLLCLKCGTIEEVHEDLLVDVEKIVTQRFGFLVQDHRLTFHGICRNCQQGDPHEK